MITPDRLAQLDRHLSELLDLDIPTRKIRIDSIARMDPDLARELSDLLSHSQLTTRLLLTSADVDRRKMLGVVLDELSIPSAPQDNESDQVGQIYGAYRIEKLIGRGGGSSVYLARRTDGKWDQEVAIKTLSRDIDTHDVLRRFLSERQILSALRHPNIATLLDGGETPEGLPYFVMEYIIGQPITDHCNANAVDLPGRLLLFQQVCEAIAYAHTHLVVHRDIKPGNTLVTRAGQVKLLDFGIAKLLSTDETAFSKAGTPQTERHVRLMTPAYASPEQRSGKAITTASDVYQLGLLLTELLTGVANARQSLGIVDEQHAAQRPSGLVKSGATNPPITPRELRGDLDWIILKSLEPDPERRYQSAGELLLDLENFLEHRPVTARASTATYSAKKFIRRRPALSIGLGLLLAAGVGYVALLLHFNAQLEQRQAEVLASANRANQVKELLLEILSAPDPYTGQGKDTRISDLLQDVPQEVAESLSGQPELQAELYGLLADVYKNLDSPQDSIRLRELEIGLRQALEPEFALATLQAKRKLAQAMLAQNRAEEVLDKLNLLRRTLAEKHNDEMLERAIVEREIATAHFNYGRPGDALGHFELAVQMLQTLPGASLELADTYQRMGTNLAQLTRFDDALVSMRNAHNLYGDALGDEHTRTLEARTAVAAQLTNLGRYSESIEIYQEVIPTLKRVLGEHHAHTLSVLNNEAFTYGLAGQVEEALQRHLEVLELRRKRFGNTSDDVGDSLQNIGAQLVQLRRYSEAEHYLNEAAEVYRLTKLDGHPAKAYPYISLAILHSYTNDTDEMAESVNRAMELLEGNVPKSHPAWLKSQCLKGDVLIRQGNPQTGLPLVEYGLEGLRKTPNLPAIHVRDCEQILARTEVGSSTVSGSN